MPHAYKFNEVFIGTKFSSFFFLLKSRIIESRLYNHVFTITVCASCLFDGRNCILECESGILLRVVNSDVECNCTSIRNHCAEIRKEK